MQIDPTRRSLLAALAAAAAVVPTGAAFALTEQAAAALVRRCVDEINAAVNSGKSGAALYREFERIFERYADVPTIARYSLGPAARTASDATNIAAPSSRGDEPRTRASRTSITSPWRARKPLSVS